MLGGVESLIVKVAVVLLALPQSSVAVNLTVAAPVAPHRSLRAVKSLLQVTPPHASVAVAPPWLASQVASAALLPLPSHSTVASAAGVVIEGGVVSLTVIVWMQVVK